ncbi:YggS family pyridoxal phosphate-dependent enzyme [bacterium AH-315-E10]|nr:YggS family pyridoxal phosphate-dependent enzyme [bacterium AH-315-E10]
MNNSKLIDIYQLIESTRTSAPHAAEQVKLIAVSKTFPAERILEIYNEGVRDFGENKVQELVAKQKQLPSDIQWHMIGHLQTNKVRQAVEHATLIHSVDSMRILSRINTIALQMNLVQDILLQCNVTGEQSKSGFSIDDMDNAVTSLCDFPAVNCVGFMTMSAADQRSDEQCATFAALRQLRDRIQAAHHMTLPELSMGMSADFTNAIMEGATQVRIGSAIFGTRDSQ